MRKVFVVAMREYQAAVKTKAFIVSLVLMPVMTIGSAALQTVLRGKKDIGDKHVAVVDYTHQLFPAIQKAADERNNKEIYSTEGLSDEIERDRSGGHVGTITAEEQSGEKAQTKPRFLFEEVNAGIADPLKVTLDLSERVRKLEIFGFFIIGKDAIEPGADLEQGAIAYYSNSPTYDDVQKWFGPKVNSRIQEIRFQKLNIDRKVVQEATKWIQVGNFNLVSVDESGNIKRAQKTNELASIFIPMGLMMLMFMVVMIGATPLMQSVLEEKTNRIAEVLLGSVPPFELMLGKLIGMVGVSLTIVTIYLVGAYLAIKRAGYADLFPRQIVWWFIVYQCLAVLMFGSVFIAIGSAVNDMREAQSLMTPVMLVVCSPMFVWFNVVREPSSTLSTVMSLFPPATPMLMTIRQAVPPGIPLWQPALGVALVLLTTIVIVFAAGRIFRVGILMQGKGPRLGEMLRWVISG
ncbi:MAG: ABC transporter permease [Planctomycetes bacterium]|nr:ABC transporter permease [Planctomycetota bacterium]MBI3832957.1 ABC transporter permease [Planctomycetota bacterium]